MNTLTNTRKPKTPPGRFDSIPSIQRSPSTPRKVRLNTVEPTRMNITMVVSLSVVSIASLSSFQVRRR